MELTRGSHGHGEGEGAKMPYARTFSPRSRLFPAFARDRARRADASDASDRRKIQTSYRLLRPAHVTTPCIYSIERGLNRQANDLGANDLQVKGLSFGPTIRTAASWPLHSDVRCVCFWVGGGEGGRVR